MPHQTTNTDDESEKVIVEVTNSDGYLYYTEMNREDVERYLGLSAVVTDETAQEVREKHDGDGGIWQRVFPDRDEPTEMPFEVVRNDDGDLVTEYEDGTTESVATDI